MDNTKCPYFFGGARPPQPKHWEGTGPLGPPFATPMATRALLHLVKRLPCVMPIVKQAECTS